MDIHDPDVQQSAAENMDMLGIEPRASRVLSGRDTTTPRAPRNLKSFAISKDKILRQAAQHRQD
eukprot:190690-Prorocentrum_lima.AAC.1